MLDGNVSFSSNQNYIDILGNDEKHYFLLFSCKAFKISKLCDCQEPNKHPVPKLNVFSQNPGRLMVMLAHIIVLFSFQSGVVNPDNKIGIKAAWTAVTLTNQGRY